VESNKDPGSTGNFEITVNGALVHSKKTVGSHGFLAANQAQQDVVKSAIEAAISPAAAVPDVSGVKIAIQWCGG